jgi:hypothetical protein
MNVITPLFVVNGELSIVNPPSGMLLEAESAGRGPVRCLFLKSYNQTDVVKKQITVEVQFGKYFAVAYDLFVKHLAFYNANYINIGVEIVPTKAMMKGMSIKNFISGLLKRLFYHERIFSGF